jgi:uncharacterized oligopeptide transporter (OPT) family protein
MTDFSLFWIIVAEFIVGLLVIIAVFGICFISWVIGAFIIDYKREKERKRL